MIGKTISHYHIFEKLGRGNKAYYEGSTEWVNAGLRPRGSVGERNDA